MSDEIHDLSRLDAFMAARRRATVLHSLWRPLLAGACGAALIIAAVAVAQPRFVFREIEVPRISYRDAQVPNIVPRDVTVDRVVPKDVEIAIPRIVTPEERAFTSRPEFASAEFKGRLVADLDGLIRFDSGAAFIPVKPDPATGHMTQDFGSEYFTKPLWGHFAFCNAIPASENLFKCLAIDHDAIVDLATTRRPKGAKS